MTKYIDAEKLKYEIERRKLSNYYTDTDDYEAELFEIIGSLQQEQLEEPVSDDLEEAVEKQIEDALFKLSYDDEDGIEQYVHDAFVAGAKWQAEQLLKGSPMPEDTVLFNKGVAEGRRLAEEEQADLFTIVALDAAQRAREQMMSEAIKGEVMDFRFMREIDYANAKIRFDSIPELKEGDRVCIIKDD